MKAVITAPPFFLEGKSEALVHQLSLANPMERLGEPKDIAEAVYHVIEAKWINGQVVFVNGGMA
ncbi:hypothetical protein [Enterococcus sp. N249-2]